MLFHKWKLNSTVFIGVFGSYPQVIHTTKVNR